MAELYKLLKDISLGDLVKLKLKLEEEPQIRNFDEYVEYFNRIEPRADELTSEDIEPLKDYVCMCPSEELSKVIELYNKVAFAPIILN